MSFSTLKSYLITEFKKNEFEGRVKRQERNSASIIVERTISGNEIHLSFPGYKSKVHPLYGITYDYRVDLVNQSYSTSLSHANIILDLYNKVNEGGFPVAVLKMGLLELARNGQEEHLIKTLKNEKYLSIGPSAKLKQYVSSIHAKQGKVFNLKGNQEDLDFETLLKSIKWIVLQEDINYPIPRYKGRKMPFERYLEAIQVQSVQELADVINRALAHYRPSSLRAIDYGDIDDIS